MIPWVLITVPAMTSLPSGGIQGRSFGWPFVHCWSIEADANVDPDDIVRILQIFETSELFETWRSVAYPQQEWQPNYPLWSKPDHWRYWGPSTVQVKWYWGPLLANVSIGIGMFMALAMLLQWRIRRRGRLLQFRLLDAVIVAGLLAIPFTSLGNTLAGSARDERLLAELRELGASQTGTTSTSDVPIWLNRLLDNQARTLVSKLDSNRSLLRVTRLNLASLKFTKSVDTAEFDQIVRIINSFDRLESVSVTFGNPWTTDLLEHIDPGHVQELDIFMGMVDLTETEKAGLANCTQVEKLVLDVRRASRYFTGSMTQSDFDQHLDFLQSIRPMTKLKELKLQWSILDEQDCPALLELKSLKTLSCLSVSTEARRILLAGNPGLKITCNPK